LINAGGSSSTNTGTIKLPLFAKENFCALRGREIFPSINPSNGDLIENYPKPSVPVVGIYSKSTFDATKYFYKDLNDNPVPLFVPTADTYNIVDCQYNTKYIDMDCSAKILTMINQFNKVATALTPYWQVPCEILGDPGINVLTVIGDTYIVQEKKEENKKKEKGKEKKDKKIKDPEIVVYDKEVVARITQQIPLLALAPIKKAFITPEYVQYTNLATGLGSVSIPQLRTVLGEMWIEYEGQRFSASKDGTYNSMVDLRAQWVNNCVKNRTSGNNETISQMLALSNAGKAGIFGTLVGTFGGDLARGAVNLLASAIPY